MMNIIYIILGCVGLYIIHVLLLHMDKRGWIYYKTKPKGGGIGSALQELQAVFKPSVKYVVEAGESKKENSVAADDFKL